MFYKKNRFSFFLLLLFSLFISHLQGAFTSPTTRVLTQQSYGQIERSYTLRKVALEGSKQFKQQVELEKSGFLGYHGDSLEFLFYQDIIKWTIEIIVEIPTRSDFHFLAVPLDPSLKAERKSQLVELFSSEGEVSRELLDSTFPLNFSLWDNANRLGHNAVELYMRNLSHRTLGYKARLHWLFSQLGIKREEVDALFDLAEKSLTSKRGVMLQLFDTSAKAYEFARAIAYPAYPTALIAANHTVDEYLLSDAMPLPYPHEMRLMLGSNGVLNPYSPIKVLRTSPALTSMGYKNYETKMKAKIKKIAYDKAKAKGYREALKNCWGV